MPEDLLNSAADLDMQALALTDRDALYGVPSFVAAAQERGIHPIIGAEMTLDGYSLILLAENQTGYGNLCWLISRSQLGEQKGQARLSSHLLREHHNGLIVLAGSTLPVQDPDRVKRILNDLKALLGTENLYIELQHHITPNDDDTVATLEELAHQLNLPLVATNGVHYAESEGHRLHDVLTATRHCTTVEEAGHLFLPNAEYYLKSAGEMVALFQEYPEAIAHTLAIANRCHCAIDFRGVSTPAPTLPAGKTAKGHLAELCASGLRRCYQPVTEKARRQLAHELQVISEIGLSEYFLVVWDIVRHAHEQGIRAQGRGSAANSIVAYLLGITRVDPIAHNLLFERFLSTEARVMPDIDIDFCARRREEVIQYLYERYGESHVGMVCNFVTYRSRSAVRDVGKALGLPAETVDQVAKAIGKWTGNGIAEAAEMALSAPEGVSTHLWQSFLTLCQEIQGLPRHLSIHCGGMCITRVPLDGIVPLEHATMPGRVVMQWDKNGVEDAGLIKIDLLSLRTLAAVDECLASIEQNHGVIVDPDRLPPDDSQVYRALACADTVGAFQVESRAQQQSLVQSRPANLDDIVIQVAIIRPGPLQGGMVHPYLRRRQGLEPVTHLHPMLAPILGETMGVVVFQEQVIRIAMVMGQFSAGEADMLRRAMSRNRSDDAMGAFRERFVAGALGQGVSRQTAEKVFDALRGFAGFGFCKSHAAAFAQLAYETLYLRAHYPAEYYCALLNNQPMGFYAPRVLIGDARRHGVTARPVHVNLSQSRCTVEDGEIRLGFEYVDGFGEAAIERILHARQDRSYRNLADFCRRTQLSKALVENLILAGAMDVWGRDRRRLVWQLGRAQYESGMELSMPDDNPPLELMSAAEALLAEYGATGVAANGQLVELLRERLDRHGILSSRELAGAENGERVKVAGMLVIRQSPGTAKGFVFITLEDEWGLMNVIVQPKVFQKQRAVWGTSLIMLVQGIVQRAHGRVDILAERVWKLSV